MRAVGWRGRPLPLPRVGTASDESGGGRAAPHLMAQKDARCSAQATANGVARTGTGRGGGRRLRRRRRRLAAARQARRVAAALHAWSVAAAPHARRNN